MSNDQSQEFSALDAAQQAVEELAAVGEQAVRSVQESPAAKAAGTPVTRRELFSRLPGAAAGAAALAAAGAAVAASGCSSSDSDSEDDLDVLEVASNAVVTLESFEEIENYEGYCAVNEVFAFSCGAQLFSSGKKVAAVLCAGETSRPLSTVGLLSMVTNAFVTVLPQPLGQDEGFNFYEVTCSDKLLVWVESNYLTGAWRVYSASIDADAMTIDTATLLDEGDEGYDAPEIAALGGQAYWIVQPAENGDHAKEDSLLKTNGGTACTSHGRFNGKLWVSGTTLVCMPRAESSSSVYYQLTAISDGGIVAKQVLPHGFKPSTATYINGAFSFGIGAGYDYGDGIANVGTYISLGDGTWLRLTRTPVTAAGRCAGWYFCKSSSRTVFIDIENKKYFTVGAPSGTEDHGDYTIRTGECSNPLFTYATVGELKNNEKQRTVLVRTLTLVALDGAGEE